MTEIGSDNRNTRIKESKEHLINIAHEAQGMETLEGYLVSTPIHHQVGNKGSSVKRPMTFDFLLSDDNRSRYVDKHIVSCIIGGAIAERLANHLRVGQRIEILAKTDPAYPDRTPKLIVRGFAPLQ